MRSGILLLGFLLSLMLAPRAHAQEVALGAQFGAPTGVALRLETSSGTYDALAAWDLGRFLFLQGHRWMVLAPLYPEQSTDISYFMGPGALAGIRIHERSSDVVLGISGNFGLLYRLQQVEFFFQLTPRLELVPATRGDFGGGLGFRYFLR